jgi:hypothetical protein
MHYTELKALQRFSSIKPSGDAMVQEAESGRQATLLSTQYGASAGANTSYQQSVLNTQNAMTSGNQMRTDAIGNLTKSLTSDDLMEQLKKDGIIN